jgi:hypothetical protein
MKLNTLFLGILIGILGTNVFFWVTGEELVVPMSRAIVHLVVLAACAAGIMGLIDSRPEGDPLKKLFQWMF